MGLVGPTRTRLASVGGSLNDRGSLITRTYAKRLDFYAESQNYDEAVAEHREEFKPRKGMISGSKS